jgi:hypothetical protein
MTRKIEYFAAESEQGRAAIEEVMKNSYKSRIDNVPYQWAIVRIADDVPVSFILVDPDRKMDFPRAEIRYGFIADVATREDRCLEGHFRGIMEYTFSKLHSAEIPLVLTHAERQLYPRFGFDVYTHHYAVFSTPELIEKKLGTQAPEGARELLGIGNSRHIRKEILGINYIKAETFPECKAALQAAAGIAREQGKTNIAFGFGCLVEPGYSSSYLYENNLVTLLRACGAQICIRGAEPEGTEDHGDWIKVLDTPLLMREALKCLDEPEYPLPKGTICFDTDAGAVTIESSGNSVAVSDGAKPGADTVKWPSSAIAQLVTGYHPARVLNAIYDTSFPMETATLLEALFPQQWRSSANENWIF